MRPRGVSREQSCRQLPIVSLRSIREEHHVLRPTHSNAPVNFNLGRPTRLASIQLLDVLRICVLAHSIPCPEWHVSARGVVIIVYGPITSHLRGLQNPTVEETPTLRP